MQGFFLAPPFQNVGANATASLPNLPLGLIVDGLLLRIGGTTFTAATHIDEIRVRLGGKAIVELTGAELQDINDYMSRTANAAFLPIWFADPNARTSMGENIGALDLQSVNYQSFSVEVDIGGATAPTLECYIIPGATKPEAYRGIFRAYLKATQAVAASGVHNLTPALGRNTRLVRTHLFHSNITRLDVKQSGFEVQGEGDNAVAQYLQNELNRTTQSGQLVFDPTVRNNQADAMALFGPSGPLPTEFKATLSGSDTVRMVSEVYTSIAGI